MKEKGNSKIFTIPMKGNTTKNVKVIGYWASTSIVAFELLAGGLTDLLRGRTVLFGHIPSL
jgi:hypothetical protein